MGEESRQSQAPKTSGGLWARAVALLTPWGMAAVLVGIILALGGGAFVTHGTIEAKGFCNFCHRAYYDPAEYAYNNKIGTKKPAGVLTGCAECHPQPYAEFKKSVHFETSKEARRPGCANCHDQPHGVLTWFDYMYFQPEEWKKVQISLHDERIWEQEVRPDLAGKAREKFVKSDSSACRGCHNLEAKTWRADIKAHKQALEKKETCIMCHFNLVHAEVPWPDKDKK